MKVANPIYDTVFKYILTNNTKVARLIISSLIGKEVLELTVNPTELIADKDKQADSSRADGDYGNVKKSKESFTVLRLDFAAKIKNKDGSEELVLIELQKAKLITDIMRFRKYLGSQYMNKEHKYEIDGKVHALPIYPIYFLGHELGGFSEEVLAVKRELYNGLTNEKIETRCEFADSLSHDALIIQIPHVTKNITKYENNVNRHLSELLLLFDQSNHDENNQHILHIDKSDVPEWLQSILRELEKAGENYDVRNRMDLEDDWFSDLEDLEREIEHKGKVIEEKAKALEEKAKALEEKAKALEEKDKTIDEKDKIIAELMSKLK